MMSHCNKSLNAIRLIAVYRVPTVAWRPSQRIGERRDVRRNNISVYDPVSHLGTSGTNMAENSICYAFRDTSVNCEFSTSVSFRDVRSLFVYNLSIFVVSSVFSCFGYLGCFLVGGCSVPATFHPQTSHQNATDTPRHFPRKPIDVLCNSHPFALRRSGRGI